ncbi:MAG: M81 family metallopeptidase [Actinomycetota bacterium]|nr:M81 family metallopeptidase [Actinomycetota bacterium]
MAQRVVIAMMEHETNTFSPVPTPLERFGRGGFGVPTGREVYDRFKGTGTGIGAFIDVADEAGMEVVTPIAANAAPSGPVLAAAYEQMTDTICEAVAAGCDAVFLDLHGAMVAETTSDGEGSLLARIRVMAPELPIGISLDLHANMTAAIVDNCDVLVGYKTYPHLDMYTAGEHAGRLMVRALAGEIDPAMVWDSRPILAQTLRMGHEDEPMGPLLEMARAAEAQGLLAASVFGGFPLADIWHAGLSVVTIADGDRGRAEAVRDEILDAAWAERAEFVFESRPLSDTIAEAKAMTDGPIVLLDHADNTASGGTQDTTAVLAEVLEQGLEQVAMFGICDPSAVQAMIAAGTGAEVTLDLGGKVDMPTIGRVGEPLHVTGTVGEITDGKFTVTVPMSRGTQVDMGPTAALKVGEVQVVVCSRNVEPFDPGCFRSLGIEPTEMRYLILKSRIHYRAGFSDISVRDIACNGVGVTSSDNTLFDFRNVRRPIYPLDEHTPATPEYGPAPVD